jgi:adenylate kinase family enzyme
MDHGARRILVIGCSGAGKSTLARAIADRYSLPLIHLDRCYWRPGWVAPGDAEWFAEVERLIAEPAWVMDGNFSSTLQRRAERADAIVFLDFPRWLCLFRVLKRVATGYGKDRADVAPGCPERFDWAFLKWIWTYPKRSRPKTLDLLKTTPKAKVILRSKHEVRRWIAAGTPLQAKS